MRHLLSVCLSTILLIMAIACSPVSVTGSTSAPSPSHPSVSSVPPALVQSLESFVVSKTGISAMEITLQNSEAIDWEDACLGAPQPQELCAQVITPGYRVILSTPQGDYEFHTNLSGQSFRLVRLP